MITMTMMITLMRSGSKSGIVFTPFHDLINTRGIPSGPAASSHRGIRLTVGICAWLPTKSTKMKWKYQSVGPPKSVKKRDWCLSLWTEVPGPRSRIQIGAAILFQIVSQIPEEREEGLATKRDNIHAHPTHITIKTLGGRSTLSVCHLFLSVFLVSRPLLSISECYPFSPAFASSAPF